ncbi:MAG: gamma-glutamyl hercynylcysteine S-oxide synthase [Blastocatellia bacterium]
MMYCERCNVDFTEGLRYCKWCGQTLVERPRNTSELPLCPNCSAAVQPKWAFCKVCGVRLTTVAREPLSAACPQCGTQANAGALHCLNCGYHLQGSDEAPGRETPSTSIIALCPTCGERIDPGSVYCKGCGAALYEDQTPFGNSAIICTACQSFNPVGSTTCRVCSASLIVTSTTLMADQSPTKVVSEKESSTLPDLADHLPLRQSSEDRTPTAERVSEPSHVTEERASPPPSAEFDSGAYTMTLDSQGSEAFHDLLPPTVPSSMPNMPAHPKGGDTSLLPGVAGSKFEQPQPTAALHMNRDTGPVEGEETAATDEAPPSGELNKPAAPVTRIDTEGLAAHRDTPPAHETFTFVSDVDTTASDGTIGFGAGSAPPAAFESDTKSSAPFVLRDEAMPSNPPTSPVAFPSDTDRVVAETTQVLANAEPQTEAIADAARRFERPQQATLPIEQMAQPPLNSSHVSYSGLHAPALPASSVPKKKSRAGLLTSMIIALFILGLAGGAAWWFLSGRKATKPTATATPSDTPTETPKPLETPKPAVPVAPESMVLIPAGTYTIGRDNESDLEKPQHAVTLPAYFVDRTEVTNEAYKKFVDEASHKPPTNWQGKTFPTGRANYPVTGITWQDATDYATWAGKRLPTEAEWEAAARGPEGHRYPWGEEWLPGQANIGVKAGEPAKDDEYPPQIMEVGGYPQGASPAGALDMIGNVWEYTADEFKLYPGNSQTLDEVAVKLKIPIETGAPYRVIRGGAFDGNPQHDASYRGFVNANRAFPKTGFRCVKDAK